MTRLKCCACHEKWRWTRRKCCACHENCNTSCENVAKVLRLPHKTTFDTLQNTSESATPATRNEATRRLKPPKMIPPAELTIGTAIRSSHGRLRTVADGCDHKRNVERTHPQPPDPQSETGTLATHSGKIFGVQWELELVSVVEQQGMLEGMNYKTCCLPLMKHTCVYIIIV